MSQTQDITVSDAAPISHGDTSRALFFGFFFLCILLPVSVSLDGLRITPLRLFLLITIIPYLFRIFTPGAGGASLTDWLMMAFGSWLMVSLTVLHGVERLPYAGINAVEMLGGYLVGRVCIRNAFQHQAFFRVYFRVLLLLLPFVAFELMTGRSLLMDAFGSLVSFGKNYDQRMGLYRVQAVFPHAILWGLFCSIAIGNLFYIYGGTLLSGGPRSLLALGMTYSSLSSGPFLAGVLQMGLILWDKVLKGRWKLLLVLAVFGYVTLDALSNRTPVQIVIEELTFSSGTGWYRLNIWEYGTQSVMNHPLFGIGLNDWERPDWMSGSSVDNFWLLMAMRYGLPGFLCLAGAIALTVYRVVRSPITDPLARRMRVGYLVTMVGLFMALTTVHVWEQMVVMVMLYIGMGSWMFSGAAHQAPDGQPNARGQSSDHRVHRDPAQSESPVPSPYARRNPGFRHRRDHK